MLLDPASDLARAARAFQEASPGYDTGGVAFFAPVAARLVDLAEGMLSRAVAEASGRFTWNIAEDPRWEAVFAAAVEPVVLCYLDPDQWWTGSRNQAPRMVWQHIPPGDRAAAGAPKWSTANDAVS